VSGMDFFGEQDRARTASGRLVFLFGLAVLAIVVAIYAAAQALLVAGEQAHGFWQPELLAMVAGGTLAIVGTAMLWKTAQLRSGGARVATMLGGRPVPLSPSDPQERVLRNVVEEMAIAAGMPVPDIYVLDDESGINAFAAGWSPADAAVAVTRGCLDQLNRDELQGVIAHEFSHVFHGDMRLNIRLMGVLFGIVCIATIGRVLARTAGSGRSRGNKKNDGAALAVFGVALMVIGYLGVFFARLIQAAVSRQREFLADASAVQYTRNPRGIGMALAKIGGLGARLQSPHADEASHLLFADGVVRMLGGLTATHPPLETRVERILPGYLRQLHSGQSPTAAVAATPLPPGLAGLAGLAGAGPVVGGPPDAGRATARQRPTAAELVASTGAPAAANVRAAHDLLAELPLELQAAAHEPARARGLVFALLLDARPARREEQLRLLPSADAAFVHDVRDLFQRIARLPRRNRLPLFELLVPALRALPEAARTELRRTARTLALADGELSPFEFALLRALERHVRLGDEAPPRPAQRPHALVDHGDACRLVLSVLARAGAPGDDTAANLAFQRGTAELALRQPLSLLPVAESTPAALEAALAELALVSPLGKRNLLTACATTASADGVLADDEVDLLRALAETWDCPLPLPID
jgi:Zn-dependent protease with chaperone function/tellurite resistance protein